VDKLLFFCIYQTYFPLLYLRPHVVWPEVYFPTEVSFSFFLLPPNVRGHSTMGNLYSSEGRIYM